MIPTIAGFPITADINLRKTGSHKDIAYEVSNHGRDKLDYDDPTYQRRIPSQGTYCYYVFVSELMLPPDQFAEFWLTPDSHAERGSGVSYPSYDYYKPRWSEAEWHCGVTWYSKEAGFDGEPRVVKIGCDYSHYWDEGRHYTLESVTTDAIRTIEALKTMYSFYRRDPWNGKCLPEAEMVEHDGKLYSPDGLEARLAFLAERSAEKPAA